LLISATTTDQNGSSSDTHCQENENAEARTSPIDSIAELIYSSAIQIRTLLVSRKYLFIINFEIFITPSIHLVELIESKYPTLRCLGQSKNDVLRRIEVLNSEQIICCVLLMFQKRSPSRSEIAGAIIIRRRRSHARRARN
jgi:hypothetical protein